MTMWLVEMFAQHGVDLLLGSTALLGLGALAMWMHQRPIHVQRMGELTLLAVMGWLVLAVVPMPRFEWGRAVQPDATPLSAELETHFLSQDGVPDELPAERGSEPIHMSSSSAADTAVDAAGLEEPGPLPALESASVAPTVLGGRPLGNWSDLRVPAGVEAPVAQSMPAASNPPLPWARLGAAFFLGGSALAAGYLLLGFVRLRRILKHARPAPVWVRELLAEAGGAAATGAATGPLPRVLVSDLRCGPFCVGVFRSTIVLPAGLVEERSSALRHVLLHEVAHARQGDGRGQMLVALTLPVLWFHPLYWWVRKRVRFAAELLADDQATGTVPRGTYARELIGLAETGWPSSPPPVAAPTILRSPSEFSRRIEMLLSRTDRLSTRCSTTRNRVQALAACGLVALATGFFGAPPVAAQDADDYQRLVAEKQELMNRMHEMQDMMQQLRAEMDAARASQVASRQSADQLAAVADKRSVEYQAALQEMQALKELASVQRADARDAAAAAEALAAQGTTWRKVLTGQADNMALALNDVLALREAAERQAAQAAPSAEHLAEMGYLGPLVPAEQVQEVAELYRRRLTKDFTAAKANQADVQAAQATREALEQFAAANQQYQDAARTDSPFASAGGQGAGGQGAGGQGAGGGAVGVGRGAGGSASSGGRSGAASGATIDPGTLELITKTIDLDGEIRLAELDLMKTEELRANQMVSDTEVMQSRIQFETLQRKSSLIRSLLVAELRATEAELGQLADTPASQVQRTRLRARLEILAGTLDVPAGGGSKNGQSGAR